MSSRKFADKVMPFLEKNITYSDKDKMVVRYGLEGLYILITKTIFITLISIILGIVIEMYIFLLAYGLLRLYASGVHSSTSLKCTIASSIIFIGSTYICKYTNIDIPYRIIIIGIASCLFAVYSPADTIKRPLIKEKDRTRRKIYSIVLCYIYFIITINIKNVYILNALTYSLLLEALMITPIVYKLFKQPYNNYLRYGNNK